MDNIEKGNFDKRHSRFNDNIELVPKKNINIFKSSFTLAKTTSNSRFPSGSRHHFESSQANFGGNLESDEQARPTQHAMTNSFNEHQNQSNTMNVNRQHAPLTRETRSKSQFMKKIGNKSGLLNQNLLDLSKQPTYLDTEQQQGL